MKIYDCFLFNNELDLLELRLREHYHAVDRFVIGESDVTFEGLPKPFYLEQNWDRFKPWADKIVRVPITGLTSADPAENEAISREGLAAGFADAEDDDLIFHSNCDEILRGKTFDKMRTANQNSYGVRMPMFKYHLNYLQIKPTLWWEGGSAVRKKLLEGGMQQLREARRSIGIREMNVITHAGWHFSQLGQGDPDLESLDHVVVQVNEYLPDNMQVDTARWAQYTSPNATKTVRDFLKF